MIGGNQRAGRRQRLLAALDRGLAAAVQRFHADVVPPPDSRPDSAPTAIRTVERPCSSGRGPTTCPSAARGAINAYGYRQSRQIVAGNTRFLNMLGEQLHVAPNESLATAERLLEAKFMSPLGGTYEVRQLEGGAKVWVATALANRPRPIRPTIINPGPVLALRGEMGLLRATAGCRCTANSSCRSKPGRPQLPASQPPLFGQPAAAKTKTRGRPQGRLQTRSAPRTQTPNRREF